MIITISGKPVSGKSTMSAIFCKDHGFKRVRGGEEFKKAARELGITILELCTSDQRLAVDHRVDENLKKIYESSLEKDILIESRTAFSFMPNAFNVFIDVKDEIMGERLFNSDRVDKEKGESLKEAIKNSKKRYEADCKHYKKIYGIDCKNKKNYTCVIDNSNMTPQETSDAVFAAYTKFLETRKK